MIISCRGYCYVRYCKIEEAQKAIKILDNYPIRPMKYLGVVRSVDNKKLCLRTVPPIPTTFTGEKVMEELRKILDGATAVRLLNKGWIQVEFKSHRHAALTRRKLVPGDITIFQTRNTIREVDWAVPDLEDYLNNLQRKKTISVRNLPRNITKQRISRAFNFLSGTGKMENITINSRSKCALVTFSSPKDAKSVLDRGSNLEFDGEKVELTWCGAEEEEEKKEKKEKREKEPGQSRPQQPREDRSHPGQAEGEQLQQQQEAVEGPVETLLRLSLSQGWGTPQYSYQTALSPQHQLLYQCSVSFPARPGVLVHGLPAFHPGLAAFSSAWTALEGISRNYLLPAVPQYPYYYYYYYPAQEQVQVPEQTI